MKTAPAFRTTGALPDRCLVELRNSAIPPEIIRLSGIRYMTDREAYSFGFRGDGNLAGLFFPYFDPVAGKFSDRYGRLKPELQTGAKYLSPYREVPRFYFIPHTTRAELEDTGLDVLIVEGEKKALSAHAWAVRMRRPYLVVGIGGCWAWRRKVRGRLPDGTLGTVGSKAIPDFDLIAWKGRRVTICLDGDVVSNRRVAHAERELLEELANRGA